MAKKSKLAEAFVESARIRASSMPGAAAHKRVAAVEKRMTSLGRTAKGMFLALAAGIGITGGAFAIGEIVRKTVEGERSISKLRGTLVATGQDAGGATLNRLNDFTERMKDLTNTSDETIRSLIAFGLNLGISADEIEGNTTKKAIAWPRRSASTPRRRCTCWPRRLTGISRRYKSKFHF